MHPRYKPIVMPLLEKRLLQYHTPTAEQAVEPPAERIPVKIEDKAASIGL